MLRDEHVRERVVVVFDVLRATTTIAAALYSGAKEIRVFDSLDAVRSAAAECLDEKLLCGESKCLPPDGFDLGNSPIAYKRMVVHGKTLFLSTTNGTRALVAARNASLLLAAALVNARAVAEALKTRRLDVTLLCAGTDGEIAPEDLIGTGAVISHLRNSEGVNPSAEARLSESMFWAASPDLVSELRKTQGAQNVIQAGLPEDVDFAAQLDVFDIVPRCDGFTMTIRPFVE